MWWNVTIYSKDESHNRLLQCSSGMPNRPLQCSGGMHNRPLQGVTI